MFKMATKVQCSRLLDRAKEQLRYRLSEGTRSDLRFHYDRFLTAYVNDKVVYAGVADNIELGFDSYYKDLETALHNAVKGIKDIKRRVPLEIDGRKIYISPEPKVNVNFIGVLALESRVQKVLTPRELSYLRAQSFPTNPILVREGQKYTVWQPNAPYWSSQGMGFVCDFEGKAPNDFLGRFVIAPVNSVDLESGITHPDFSTAQVLSKRQVMQMDGFIEDWEKLTDTGLWLPVCGKKWKKNLGKIQLEDILKPFAPISFGCSRDYDYSQIKLLNPRERISVWTKKNYEN